MGEGVGGGLGAGADDAAFAPRFDGIGDFLVVFLAAFEDVNGVFDVFGELGFAPLFRVDGLEGLEV